MLPEYKHLVLVGLNKISIGNSYSVVQIDTRTSDTSVLKIWWNAPAVGNT